MLQYHTIAHEENKEWIMLLHGLGGSSSIWYKQIPELSKHYNLILPDFFGHGVTRQTLPAYTFEGLADEMAKVLDHLDLARVHILGISMGSGLGCFMGVYHGDRIKSMVLGGATVGMDTRTTLLLHAGNLLKNVMPYMWIYRFFAWIMMPKKTHALSRNIFVREAHKLGGKEFRKWYKLLMQFPMYQLELQRPVLLETPKLFISGRQDHLFLKQIVNWAAWDPNAMMHIIENAGHLCSIENPEEFNRVSLQYLHDQDSCRTAKPGFAVVHGRSGDNVRAGGDDGEKNKKNNAVKRTCGIGK